VARRGHAQALEHSLRVWGSEGVMGVWIKVPRDKVAVATEAGFDFHHAGTGHVMMNFWLPDDTPTTLPACGATQLGVRARREPARPSIERLSLGP
jgi:hypothetical protein